MSIVWKRVVVLVVCVNHLTGAFLFPPASSSVLLRTRLFETKSSDDISDQEANLKAELAQYLAKRKEAGADEKAQLEVGKIVGGTKGNKVLDFISGAPVKEKVIMDAPNIFDYSELSKYGFSYLSTPIMQNGGRLRMYELMGLDAPPIKPPPEPITVELKIDREGKEDQSRYSGLKIKQVLDDDAMAEALAEADRKARAGERLKPKLMEEDYVLPFSDKKNIGPQQTPDWTPEMLDEEGRKRGMAAAWAREAKAGAFISDPFESLFIEGGLRYYSIFAAILSALAFGKASPVLFTDILHWDTDIQELIQIPALMVIVTSIGSSAYSFVQAPQKNRSKWVWAIKGLFGGPVAISQFRTLEALITQNEENIRQKLEEEKA